MSTGKAKTLLEKALNADPNHLPAIYLLAEIYEQDLEVVSFLKYKYSRFHVKKITIECT